MTVTVIFLAVTSLLGIMASALLTLRLRRLQQRLALQEASGSADEEEPPEAGELAPPLPQADLHRRLQQERGGRQLPERYRHVAPLAERGLAAEEIAAVLGLSRGEVEQLLTLARVARPQPLARPARRKKGVAGQKS